jgi:CubicO group peptidase (beta-lactamase class C family)
MIPDIQIELELDIGVNEPGIAVAVARNGEITHKLARGLANLEWAQQIEPCTIFGIGSLTKQFTAVSVMMLAEQGRLSIDAPVTEFIANLEENYEAISLRHLLTHTAGIPNYTDISGYWTEHSRRDATPEEISDYFMSVPLEFSPGQRFQYSNSGYILLGRVIEAATGQPYAEFLRDNIFRPQGMNDSVYLDAAPIITHRASGYARTNEGFRNAPFLSMTWPYAAGGIGSSVVDLIKWQNALSAGGVIRRETLDLMHIPTTLRDGTQCSYGMGWMIDMHEGGRVLHHSGLVRGFSSHMAWFAEQDLTIVVLSNLQSFPAEQLGGKLANAILAL